MVGAIHELRDVIVDDRRLRGEVADHDACIRRLEARSWLTPHRAGQPCAAPRPHHRGPPGRRRRRSKVAAARLVLDEERELISFGGRGQMGGRIGGVGGVCRRRERVEDERAALLALPVDSVECQRMGMHVETERAVRALDRDHEASMLVHHAREAE